VRRLSGQRPISSFITTSSRASFTSGSKGEDGYGLVLQAGEIVVLPRNDMHVMGSDLSLPPAPSGDIIQPPKDGGLFSMHHGGNGGRTRMIYDSEASFSRAFKKAFGVAPATWRRSNS
jgi:hypothetical protein